MRFYVRNHYEHMPFIDIPVYAIRTSSGAFVVDADGSPIQSMSRKLIEYIFGKSQWANVGAEIVELDE